MVQATTTTLMRMQRMGSRAQQQTGQRGKKGMLKEVNRPAKMAQQRVVKERKVQHLMRKVQRATKLRTGQLPRERKAWSSWVRMGSPLHPSQSAGHHPSLRHPSTSRSWCQR
jgi:hypothetical protein